MKQELERAAEICTHMTSDSRGELTGACFVALKGQSVDGHDFVLSSLAAGARFAVVEKGYALTHASQLETQLIRVSSTHEAHRELASLFREKFKGVIIAVGGSSGKTSTKEMLATLL